MGKRPTLRACLKQLPVGDDLRRLVQRMMAGFVRLLRLAPEVGAAVHAGYVDHCYAFQRQGGDI